MWRFPEEIRADLESGDPERIAAGLRDLVDAMESVVNEFELPPLDVGLLAPFGKEVPPEVQRHLARILAGYRSFHPPLDRAEMIHRMTELAIMYGDDPVALDASMEITMSPDPPGMAVRVLDRLRERGLHDSQEASRTGNYLSYLLDAPPAVREAVITALAPWKGDRFAQAVDCIRPQLEEHELRRLAG